jgi:hypothetical protein
VVSDEVEVAARELLRWLDASGVDAYPRFKANGDGLTGGEINGAIRRSMDRLRDALSERSKVKEQAD